MSVSSSPTNRGWRGEATGRSAVCGTGVVPQHIRRAPVGNVAGVGRRVETVTTSRYLGCVSWTPRSSSWVQGPPARRRRCGWGSWESRRSCWSTGIDFPGTRPAAGALARGAARRRGAGHRAGDAEARQSGPGGAVRDALRGGAAGSRRTRRRSSSCASTSTTSSSSGRGRSASSSAPASGRRELIEESGRVVGVRAQEGEEIRARLRLLRRRRPQHLLHRRPAAKRTISTLMGWWEGSGLRAAARSRWSSTRARAALRLDVPRDGDPGEHRHLRRRAGRDGRKIRAHRARGLPEVPRPALRNGAADGAADRHV